jgi:MEMO1 family protein
MYKKIFILFSLLLIAYTSVQTKSAPVIQESGNIIQIDVPEIAPQEMFFEENNFYQAIEHSQNIKAQRGVRAVIVPHHLLAASFITDTLKQASNPNIDRVIIIGPNHENIGSQPIVTSVVNWQTISGTLDSDPELVGGFMSDLDIQDDANVFINEHSIGAHVAFVKHYFPQAGVMGVALSTYADRAEVDRLGQWLTQNTDDDTLIIFSIDFSHYLDKMTADKMDIITKELIEQRDINKILELSNDNVDSPASLATALLYAEELDLNTNILQQGNSFNFLNIKVDETTSYFSIIFN